MAAMEENRKLHVLFLPFFTPSHMIPLVNAARLFAGEGVKATILTTKHNAALVRSSVDADAELGRDISFHCLKFPAAEMGLPEGVENFPAATSAEMMGKVYMALPLMQQAMEDAIRSITPHCIFSDMFYPWTVKLASEMNIPRIMFYVNSFMSHCVPENLEKYEPHKTVESESEPFLVPGLPDKVEMKRSNLEDYFKTPNLYSEIIKGIKETERHSFALVFDNVYELEPEYADYFEKIIGTKIRTIGPLFHFANKGSTSNDIRGTVKRLDWLSSQSPHSVVYISFGSITRFSRAQIHEIATGLEKSNRPFIWVVRKSDQGSQLESWLPEGFEERVRKSNQGLVFEGWAPQVAILQHEAIGGFMTHCGWNSILEAMVAGVPLITWPLFAEQFYNEMIVRILKFRVSLGSEVWNRSPVIEGVVAGSSDIEKAIVRLMCDSDESREIRIRAKEVAEIVKGAVEAGGSSHSNLLELIQDLHSCAFEVKM